MTVLGPVLKPVFMGLKKCGQHESKQHILLEVWA